MLRESCVTTHRLLWSPCDCVVVAQEKQARPWQNEWRSLPAVPTPAARASQEESEQPEHQADQKQDPQDVQRSREESAATQQQQQEHQNDQRSYQFPSPPFGRGPIGSLSRFYKENRPKLDTTYSGVCKTAIERADVVIRRSTSLG
jgi:hypothetical protein